MSIPQLTSPQQTIVDANERWAAHLHARLEAFRAANPERFPGIERLDVEAACTFNEGEHHMIAVWAVASKDTRLPQSLYAQDAAYTLLNERAPQGTESWLQGARFLAPNIADRQGRVMLFGTHIDVDAAIESLEKDPDRTLRPGIGLPETNNPKPDWVGIMGRLGNARVAYALDAGEPLPGDEDTGHGRGR